MRNDRRGDNKMYQIGFACENAKQGDRLRKVVMRFFEIEAMEKEPCQKK